MSFSHDNAHSPDGTKNLSPPGKFETSCPADGACRNCGPEEREAGHLSLPKSTRFVASPGDAAKDEDPLANVVSGCTDMSTVYSSSESKLSKNVAPTFPWMTHIASGSNALPSVRETGMPLGSKTSARSEDTPSVGDIRGAENSMLLANHIAFARLHDVALYDAAREAGVCGGGAQAHARAHVHAHAQDGDLGGCAHKLRYNVSTAVSFGLFKTARRRVVGIGQLISEQFSETMIGSAAYSPPPRTKQECDARLAETRAIFQTANARAYNGQTVNVFPEFSHAVNRLSHTQIRETVAVDRRTSGGTHTELVALWKAFFNPSLVTSRSLSDIFNPMLGRAAQKVTLQYTGSMLVNPPEGALTLHNNGIHLAARDCIRGREVGMAPLNVARQRLGLPAYASLINITSNEDANYVAKQLAFLYGTGENAVENVELFAGGLAEPSVYTPHGKDSTNRGIIGETFARIWNIQLNGAFRASRASRATLTISLNPAQTKQNSGAKTPPITL